MAESCFDEMSEAFSKFNQFVSSAAGTTGQALEYANEDKKKVLYAFFKPYADPSDFCIRAATIVSAPFAFAILAAEALLACIYFAFDALAQVCIGDIGNAAESIGSSGTFLLGMFAAVIAAIISPLVNLIDLVAGGVTTIMEQCEGERMDDGM